jgi:hypothetical protein
MLILGLLATGILIGLALALGALWGRFTDEPEVPAPPAGPEDAARMAHWQDHAGGGG